MKAFSQKPKLETPQANQAGKGLTPHEAAAARASGFVDHRPEAAAQRQLQAMMHQSPQVQRQARLRAEMNNSPRVRAQVQLQATIHKLPRRAAQRQQLERRVVRATSSPVVQRLVGYEYQMVNSEVTVRAAEENEIDEYDFQGWKPIQDGSNLELMTTETLKTADDVEEVVGQMQELGRAVRGAQVPTTIASYGGQAIDITKSDDKAQPQVNFDLSLADMAGPFGTQLEDLRAGDKYFGADDFNWDVDRSNQITSLIAAIMKQAEAIISDEVISERFPVTGFGNEISEELFKDIRGYVVTDVTQQMQKVLDPQLLTKDVPLLVKTDLTELRESLKTRIEEETGTFGPHDKRLVLLAQKVWPSLELEGLSTEASNTIKQSIGNSLYTEKVKHSPQTSQEGALGILLELRRAKQIGVDDWVTFAVDAFETLGLLYEPEQKNKKKNAEKNADSDSGYESDGTDQWL